LTMISTRALVNPLLKTIYWERRAKLFK
jgi:hypothetical protein